MSPRNLYWIYLNGHYSLHGTFELVTSSSCALLTVSSMSLFPCLRGRRSRHWKPGKQLFIHPEWPNDKPTFRDLPTLTVSSMSLLPCLRERRSTYWKSGKTTVHPFR